MQDAPRMATVLAPASGSVGRRRYAIGVMLLLLISVAYVDRMNMSVAGPVVAKQFHLSPFVLGLVYSAFFWGYAATMLPGGWIIDRGGKHLVLPLAVLAWTFTSMATGFVTSLAALFCVRILLGVGEAPAFPSSNLIIREWSPLRERGVFTALMQTGTLFGPGLASAPAAYLVMRFGWRPSFWILSSLGLLWLLGWLMLYRRPEMARWISEEERQHILATRAVAADAHRERAVPMSVRSILQQRPMIGILLANGPQTYTLYFLLTWLPSYLTSADRGFNLMNSGVLTSAMFLLAMAGAIALAYVSDRWLSLSETNSRRGVRRHVVATVMFCALVAVAATPWVRSRYLLVLTVAIVLMMVTAAITLTYALTSDLIVDEASAGRTFATVSFGGQIMGLLAPIVTGWIVGHAGFTPVFIVTAALLMTGTLAALVLPNRPLQPVGSSH